MGEFNRLELETVDIMGRNRLSLIVKKEVDVTQRFIRRKCL